jgi:hypothetical protein
VRVTIIVSGESRLYTIKRRIENSASVVCVVLPDDYTADAFDEVHDALLSKKFCVVRIESENGRFCRSRKQILPTSFSMKCGKPRCATKQASWTK